MREEVVGSRIVFEGQILRVRVDEVVAADGHRGTREVVEHPGAVGVVIVDDDEIVLVRQYRHAVERALLEIPAGKLEPGEAPAATAERECIEEVGLRPRSLQHLVTYFATPGFSNERFHLYLSDDVEPATLPSDDGEVLAVERVPLWRLDALLEAGEVRDAKTLLGLSLLKLRLR